MKNDDSSETGNITGLLAAWKDGDSRAAESLFAAVENELRRIAHNYMRRENAQHTLQTTALINEAYLKLTEQRVGNWQNRAHFFAIAAKIMRRVLLNYAREKNAFKRGAGAPVINLDDAVIFAPEESAELIALDEALKRLAEFDELKSRIVELRYFGGLTVEETAEVTELSVSTIAVHWRLARAWLHREMRQDLDPAE